MDSLGNNSPTLFNIYQQLDDHFEKNTEEATLTYNGKTIPRVPNRIMAKYLHSRSGEIGFEKIYKNAYKCYTKKTPFTKRISAFFHGVLGTKSNITKVLNKETALADSFNLVKGNIENFIKNKLLTGIETATLIFRDDKIKVSDESIIKFCRALQQLEINSSKDLPTKSSDGLYRDGFDAVVKNGKEKRRAYFKALHQLIGSASIKNFHSKNYRTLRFSDLAKAAKYETLTKFQRNTRRDFWYIHDKAKDLVNNSLVELLKSS